MSKFLTPPVWYDKNGNLNEMLTGEASGGGVAVGPVARAGSGGIAIGSNTQASSGGIAIGSNAHAASNTIQLGYSAQTFALHVGNGQGTLKIGSIAFRKMTISTYNRVSIESPGVYLCCTTTGPAVSASSDVAIFFINDINNIASVLSSTAGSCSYENSNHVIKPGTNYTIKYCFKIISF